MYLIPWVSRWECCICKSVSLFITRTGEFRMLETLNYISGYEYTAVTETEAKIQMGIQPQGLIQLFHIDTESKKLVGFCRYDVLYYINLYTEKVK